MKVGMPVEVSPDTVKVVDPHSGTVLTSYVEADAVAVDAAVRAARRQFDEGRWPLMSVDERVAELKRLFDIVFGRSEEFVTALVEEIGMPVTHAREFQTRGAAYAFRAALGSAERFGWTETRSSALFGEVEIRRVPVGVVAALVPWNAPLVILFAKVVPALAAGCTVVVKPAGQNVRVAQLLRECIAEANLGEGVFEVVLGETITGQALVAHPAVDHVTFTGSTRVGRLIAEQCGRQLKRCSLELGGKSAALVLADADVPRFAAAMRELSFGNTGQACISHSRILVPAQRHEEIAEALVSVATSLPVGDPRDPQNALGPLVSADQAARAEALVERAVAAGARVLAGGSRLPELGPNYFAATVLDQVTNDMEIARTEVFGPVISVIEYDSVEEAVAIANDSDYGLAGSVWTADHRLGTEIARKIRSGTVGVDTYGLDFTIPFGGFRDSGIGREYGSEGIAEFTEISAILGADISTVPAEEKRERS